MIFFIFGWGSKRRAWALPEGKQLIANWDYFHFLFFPVKRGKIIWHLVGDVRSEDRIITYEEAKALLPNEKLDISVWEKYGLALLPVVAILIGVFPEFVLPIVIIFSLVAVWTALGTNKWRKSFLYTFLILLIVIVVAYYFIQDHQEYWQLDNLFGLVLFALLPSILITILRKAFSKK